MSPHPLRTLIETCDAAISRRDFDALMAFYAEDAALVVKPGMVVRAFPPSAAPSLPSPITLTVSLR